MKNGILSDIEDSKLLITWSC